MLRLLTLLATAAFVIGSPIKIEDMASNKVQLTETDSLIDSLIDASVEPKVLLAEKAKWKLQVEQAPWSARAGGSLEYTEGKGFLLHGVGIYDQDDSAAEEVWTTSGDNVKKWTLVSMRGTPFEPVYSSINIMDKDGVHYRIQGTDNARTEYNDVWRSADQGRTWVAQHTKGSQQLQGTRYLGAGVALESSPSTLLIWGGQDGSNVLADVWRSTDSGQRWKKVADTDVDGRNKAFGPRSVNVGLATTMKYKGEDDSSATETDVVYQLMGYISADGGGLYSNDIWISTGTPNTIGASWKRIVKNAPWLARGDAAAEMSSNGIIVLSSGVSTKLVEEQNRVLNDVWASLDGGYSWGLCSEDAEFEDRRFQYSALDSAGHLFVMGGRSSVKGEREERMADIWRSEMTFHDVATVAQECNLLIPSCGAGLKCLPDMPGFRAGAWGVMCDACPGAPTVDGGSTGGSGSSGMSSIATVAIVILVIVALGAAAAAYHFYRKSILSSAASTEQAWWGKNGTTSLVGGDAQAPSDAMYNPLNIRDSNATM